MKKYESTTFLAELARLLQEDEQDMSLSTLLQDIDAWDSLNIVSLITYVDREYELMLSPQAIGDCETVGDLLSLVERGSMQAA